MDELEGANRLMKDKCKRRKLEIKALQTKHKEADAAVNASAVEFGHKGVCPGCYRLVLAATDASTRCKRRTDTGKWRYWHEDCHRKMFPNAVPLEKQ